MLLLLKTKTIFKKIWHFLKIYWYVPLLLSWAIILWFIAKKQSKDITEVFWTAEESFRKQLHIINKSHEKEIQERNQILKRYEDTIKQLEQDRKQKNEELSAKEKKKVKELVEKYKDDPEAYAREIADKFGFEFVE